MSCLPPAHGPLLPNLHSLGWTSNDKHPESPLQVLPLISPSLRSLELVFCDTVKPIPHFCRAIEGIAGREDVRLASLRVNTITNNDINVAGALAFLLEIQTGLESVEICRFDVAGPVGKRIPLLPLLRHVEFNVRFDEEVEVRAFLENLAQGCPLIETLEIGMDTPSDEWPAEALQFQTIQPLLQLKSLKYLYLRYDWKIVIEDADVQSMGNAWPNLGNLTITSSAPISILSAFAQAFPSTLKDLTLTFNFPHPPTFDQDTPAFSSLPDLYIWVSSPLPPQMVSDVAAFLSWVCAPNTTISPPDDSTPKLWRRVEEVVEIGRRLQAAAVGRERRDR